MNMIEVKNLVKDYGKFRAVNDVSFSVAEGEIFGFLGINGAGKTTTLSILAGTLAQSSGSVSIAGWDIQKNPREAKALTGYIPDRPYVYEKLSAREYLYFLADLYQVDSSLIEPRIDKLLKEFGLQKWQNELIESFSHGMRQRIATCGALIHDPAVLIIDEPMVGLDPHGAKLLKDSMKNLAEQGKSIFLSTHSLNVAEEVADRLAIIDHGTIIALGTIEEIQAGLGIQASGLENLFLQLTSNIYQH
ncbi:MAG: ABC transporter ATP-binding protein [Bdellovibrionales bacterium]|nr:ABC transporter ATP-binding protein [Bdellovibrionales bacterium]